MIRHLSRLFSRQPALPPALATDNAQVAAQQAALYTQREQEIYAYADQQLEFISGLVRQHFLPLLDYDEAQQRSIITLSGGALVAGVTLFQLFLEKSARIGGEWLLGTSWALFALTIVALLSSGSNFGMMKAYTWFLYNNRAAIHTELAGIPDLDARQQRANELIMEAVNKTDELLTKARQAHLRRWTVASLSFLGAIISFLAFGLINL
jgi:hypothetical protein